jgi:hypothetical protein
MKKGRKTHSFAVRKEKTKTLKTALSLAFTSEQLKSKNQKPVGFLKPKKGANKLFAIPPQAGATKNKITATQ